jgi:hypothetical protein
MITNPLTPQIRKLKLAETYCINIMISDKINHPNMSPIWGNFFDKNALYESHCIFFWGSPSDKNSSKKKLLLVQWKKSEF